jgi:serine/threonine protein kinase
MSELSAEIVGKVVQGYKILKPLGQGKFSTVYQAQRHSDQKLVALKIVKVNKNLTPKIFDMMDQKQREKCLQEVKLLQVNIV